MENVRRLKLFNPPKIETSKSHRGNLPYTGVLKFMHHKLWFLCSTSSSSEPLAEGISRT